MGIFEGQIELLQQPKVYLDEHNTKKNGNDGIGGNNYEISQSVPIFSAMVMINCVP